MMFLHAKGTIHDVMLFLMIPSISQTIFPRRQTSIVAGQASFIRIQPSEISFTFCLAVQFDLTFTLWRDFLDCLTFKIDDIILFEQGKHLLINIISIEILWDSKLIRFSRILYFLELLYFQNICNLFFFIINK